MKIDDVARISGFAERFDDPSWDFAAGAILRGDRIPFTRLTRASQGENVVYLVDDKFVLKIYRPDRDGFQRETRALTFCGTLTNVRFPRLVSVGEFGELSYLVMTRLLGQRITRKEWLNLGSGVRFKTVENLATSLRQLHSNDASTFEFDWSGFIARQIDTAVVKQAREGGNPAWPAEVARFLAENLDQLRPGSLPFLHGDVHFGNCLFDKSMVPSFFDLADSLKGPAEYDMVPVGLLMIQGEGELQRHLFRTYGYPDSEINDSLRARLFLLTLLYEHSSLKRYAERLGVDPLAHSLSQLERAIWNFV